MGESSRSVRSVEVQGVLGRYDHSIVFDDESFLIIYGPNGIGKTKLLEITNATLNFDYISLAFLPFESVTIHLDDGAVVKCWRDSNGSDPNEIFPSARSVVFSVREANQKSESEYRSSIPEIPPGLMRRYVSSENGYWEDYRTGELMSDVEFLRMLTSRGRISDIESKSDEFFREFFESISSSLVDTHRLTHDRKLDVPVRRGLYDRPASQTISAVRNQSAMMSSLIERALTESSRVTQELDRTFPKRVLERASGASESEREVRARYDEQSQFRERLAQVVSVDMMQDISLPQRELHAWETGLLSLYMTDTERKLEPFKYLVEKIELLCDIINKRLLSKRVSVSSTEGLQVIGEDGERIELDSLSSGEKHEIILMFHLLFSTERGALVLVDEPEISLHVAWQMSFMSDVSRIADLVGFKMLVATHSPQIVNDRWDRAIRLGPEVEVSVG